MENYPPYTISDKMLNYVSNIMEKIGEANYFESLNRFPELRKKTRIKSIHSSLAIENNQLSLFQVEDVINGKMVVGEQKDIQEVKNAYKAYSELDNVNPYCLEDLKKIQGLLTFAIEDDSGKFRNHGEAVYDGDVQIFMAPPHTMVPVLMDNLFNWMNKAKEEVNPLILSSIFHYEFVFIHPFSDGNGRTARLWQTAILADWKDLFKYIPIESIIRKHQDEYYTVIQNCNNAGNSNEFIEFMLKIIEEAVDGMIVEQQRTTQETTQKTTQKTTQEKILDLINKNPSITQEELAKALNITRDGISYNIKVLKENGIIERVGSTRKGKWKIL
jgi:Fic family protein